MKNLVGIIVLAMLVTSCNMFQKPSMSEEEIDAMMAENAALKSQLNQAKDLEDQLAMTRMQLNEAHLKLVACEEAAKSKVHIIVGAFKSDTYAKDYSRVMKEAGYEGKILAGPYSFNLVTASSHESLPAALKALGAIRENVIEEAWVYLE